MAHTVTPQILKGFRDFLPAEAGKRQHAIKIIRSLFEKYGFQPIETPAVEYLETFTGNIGEDEKLFMKFEDHGGRKVALRYDQTVPTCRYIALHKDKLTFPFKRYQIQTVWRSEKPQKGRYREFLQCDADIFGISGPEADAEVIALSLDIYRNLGFKEFIVKINDRAIYKDSPYEVIVAIDKLHKIGRDGVIAEIVKKGFSQEDAQTKLDAVLNAQPTETIKKIFAYLRALGFKEENYQFDPSIARSFNYSTGAIWEVVIPGFSAGSVLGGERYDKLIGRFQNQDIPATGFAVGFDRTIDAMEEMGLLKTVENNVKVLVSIFSDEQMNASLELTQFLRNNNINTDIYLNAPFKLDKQLKYANKNNIPYVAIIGPEEVEKNIIKIKNMQTGEQNVLSKEQLLVLLKS